VHPKHKAELDGFASGALHPMNITERSRASLFPAVLAVSTASLFVRFAIAPLGDAPPLAAAFWRGAIAGVAFLPILLSPKYFQQMRELTARQFWLIALATTVIATHQICFINSLSLTSVAASTFLTSTQPIFTALLGGLLIREKVSARSWLAIFGAIIGMGIITLSRPSENAPHDHALYGNLLALLAALLASLYTLAARRLRQKTALVPYMSIVHFSGSIFLGIIIAVTGTNVSHYSSATWTGLLLLGLVPTFIGHSLLTYAVGHLRAFVVNAAVLGEPVGATILAAIFLNELPSPWTLIGGAIIIGCILLIVLERDVPVPAEEM
jgi:drug/metabolite transporter (DMT)-like permease